jgi:hypothetical protein
MATLRYTQKEENQKNTMIIFGHLPIRPDPADRSPKQTHLVLPDHITKDLDGQNNRKGCRIEEFVISEQIDAGKGCGYWCLCKE